LASAPPNGRSARFCGWRSCLSKLNFETASHPIGEPGR
jgi:hypothetical protein